MWKLLVAALVVACHRNPPPPAPEVDPKTITWPAPADAAAAPAWRTDSTPDPRDPSVAGTGKTFMVASESTIATKVGRDILAAGGNAVDAAVATAFALAVAHPSAGNIGGGGFAVVRIGPGKAVALDFREVGPAAATANMYLDANGKPTMDSVIGHRASGVPGAVAGLHELHKRYGKLPWKRVVTPAVVLARDGFLVDSWLAQSLARDRTKKKLEKFPTTAAIWIPNGVPAGQDTQVKIPELAATLQRIADQGPDGFYKGETAAAIVAEMKAGNGIITAEDLAAYKPVWRDPLRFSYRGRSLVSMPPPSSGGIVLAMTAGMLREVEVGKWAWYGADHVHRLAEVWKRGFAARNNMLGDPAFAKQMPIAKLLSGESLDRLAKTITSKSTSEKALAKLVESDHTTNLCVVDASGMAVALTTTLNGSFGSGVTVKGAGFLLNNEMDDFTVKPGSPNMFGLVQGEANKIEPGKRMLSSMSPTIVEDDKGQVVMLAGAGGGPRIITAVWQTLSNVIDFGKRADVAVARERVHQQDLPEELQLEAYSIDQQTTETLHEAMEHALKWGDDKREFGAVTAIVRTDTGWEGTADPRGGGAAMGD